jgi:hypothetical protein
MSYTHVAETLPHVCRVGGHPLSQHPDRVVWLYSQDSGGTYRYAQETDAETSGVAILSRVRYVGTLIR